MSVCIITCTKCGASADANTRQADGWTVAPAEERLCSKCNGHDDTPTVLVKAKQRGKFYRIPFSPKKEVNG